MSIKRQKKFHENILFPFNFPLSITSLIATNKNKNKIVEKWKRRKLNQLVKNLHF